jgi:hypothetical protein
MRSASTLTGPLLRDDPKRQSLAEDNVVENSKINAAGLCPPSAKSHMNWGPLGVRYLAV